MQATIRIASILTLDLYSGPQPARMNREITAMTATRVKYFFMILFLLVVLIYYPLSPVPGLLINGRPECPIIRQMAENQTEQKSVIL